MDNDEANTPNSDIVFSLQDPALPFAIDSVSGSLSTRPNLMPQVYNITVLAIDRGNPPLTGTGTVIVTVAPPNFDAPMFPDNLTFNIMENDNSTGPLFSFLVTDTDDGFEGTPLVMLLQSEYSDNFTLTNGPPDANGDVESTISYRGGPGFNREMLSSFILPVQAVDQGIEAFRLSAVAVLTVEVVDVNDNPPVFVGAPYTATVSENAPLGTSIASAQATDADIGTNADITYSFIGYNGEEFSINGTSGDITVSGTLLLVGRQERYSIDIEARDGSFSSITTINITVMEVNDNPPVFSESSMTVNLPETTPTGLGVPLFYVNVSDADAGMNGEVTLSLQQDGYLFGYGQFNDSTYYIFLNESLDYEVSFI